MSEYQADTILPSKGLLYEDRIPGGEVTIRALTTQDEKKIFGSSSERAIYAALSGCVVSPEGVDVMDLVPADQYYLLLEIRKLTYGSKYKAKITCPDCKKSFVEELNLNEVTDTAEMADDDVELPIIAKLPICNKEVELRLLTGRDAEQIEKLAQKQASKTQANVGELEYIIRLAKMVVAIDGEKVEYMKAREFVEKLHARDSSTIFTTLEKYTWGISPEITVNCPYCREEKEIMLPIGKEFFRPTI